VTVDRRALDDLRGLVEHDEALAARAARLRDLDAQISVLRARAEAIDAFFAVYAEEEARRGGAVAAAEVELGRRRDELAAAERELAQAGDDESRERAQSVVARARDHIAVAESGRARAAAAADELERDAQSLPQELVVLEERARSCAAEAPELPAPAPGARGLVEWASHAHAELFVAAGQVDAQRERVIREANELATMMLGEPTYGSTVAQLAQRVLPLAGE
jgi:chromosome segregation ATPase